MLTPTGFWSYTRSDDKASHGRLSQLRQLLAEELQQKIGREPRVHIFQDNATIPYGGNWSAQIHEALDRSSFIIPIITPAFLQSEWCCREVNYFIKRQKKLVRDDLIFPISYIDISAFETVRNNECFDADLITYLRNGHRWADCLRLRLLYPRTSLEFRKRLDDIANAIYGSLCRVVEPPAITKSPAGNSRLTALRVSAEASGISPLTAGRREFQVPEMVFIPPGRFLMGVTQRESDRERIHEDHTRPQHEVTLRRGFYLGKYPVTRREFAAFVSDTGYDAGSGWQALRPGYTDAHPVVHVSAIDAESYARWLSEVTGQSYRLPSEAAWEYAARAGTTTARFWGDGWDQAHDFVDTNGSGVPKVGSFKPNDFGLYDMLGNVWQWTADRWHDNYREAPSDGSVWLSGGSVSRRVLRGGTWDNDPRYVRAGCRNGDYADYRDYGVGFRVARTV